MARAVIAYHKDLPEIPGRRPWEKPISYLVKDDAAPTVLGVGSHFGRSPTSTIHQLVALHSRPR